MRTAHATIPKGNIGDDQYTVPDTVAVEPSYVCCFHLALANIRPWSLVQFFQIFFWRTVNSKPPTISFGIVTRIFSDNLLEIAVSNIKPTLSQCSKYALTRIRATHVRGYDDFLSLNTSLAWSFSLKIFRLSGVNLSLNFLH